VNQQGAQSLGALFIIAVLRPLARQEEAH